MSVTLNAFSLIIKPCSSDSEVGEIGHGRVSVDITLASYVWTLEFKGMKKS